MLIHKRSNGVAFFTLIVSSLLLSVEVVYAFQTTGYAAISKTKSQTSVIKDSADNPMRPNIILILADDMGWSDLGCYGGEIPTPNLDALAQGGIRFTQFYNNAVCGPTRCSLLTGLYAQRVGHTGRNWNQPTDYSKSITLGEGLQRAGYHTMMVGKWQDPDLPTKRGFDRFYGPQCAAKISYYDEVELNPFFLDDQRVKLPSDFYLTDALTDYAVEFLNDATTNPKLNQKPFFLYVAHIAPHWPLHAREVNIAPNRAKYLQWGWDKWRNKRLENQYELGLIPAAWPLSPRPDSVHAWAGDKFKSWQAERMAVYAAQIESIDRSTGRILDVLKKTGKMENTLVIFLSDNGAAPDGGMYPSNNGFGFDSKSPTNNWRLNGESIKGGSGPDNLPGPPNTFAAYGLGWALMSNTPFRATKMTGYEGGIRTPLIAYWPAGINEHGKIVNDIGHVFDLMPTFLELAKGSYPTELKGRKLLPLDGKSLVPILQGRKITQPDYLAFRVPQDRVLRSGKWKIISRNENTPWELYDMTADGTETTNIAKRHPEIVKQLAIKWEAWVKSVSVSPM